MMRNIKIFFVFFSYVWLVACSGLEHRLERADSGFGGTGINMADSDEASSGFGGTGIIGIISDFGSIWVNGVEVDYPENIRIESNLNDDDELKLGQMVILETDATLDEAQHPTTQTIRVHYSLAGKIQKLKKGSLQVNGQWVVFSQDTPKDEGLHLAVGEYIAVNAMQQNTQQWMASRLNRNPGHTVIDRPELNIDFSSRVHRILADQRLSFMMKRWQLRGVEKVPRYQWNPARRMHKPVFPLKYQRVHRDRIGQIRMQRERLGNVSDKVRAKRETHLPNRRLPVRSGRPRP